MVDNLGRGSNAGHVLQTAKIRSISFYKFQNRDSVSALGNKF